MPAILRRPIILAAVGTIVAPLFSEARCLGAQVVKVFNPSFEQPVVTDPSGIYPAPSAAAQGAGLGDSPWVFVEGSGIAARGATFAFTGGELIVAPPDGNQVLYLEGTDNVTQLLTFPVASQYTLTFDKGGFVGVGFFSANDGPVPMGAAQFAPLSDPEFEQVSIPFTITAPGLYSLGFGYNGPSAGPEQLPPSLVDNVSITPEPTCSLILGLGLVLVRRRRPRRSASAPD